MSSHELDARLLDNAVKARVASLYLPLIGIVLDVSAQLHDPYSKSSSVNYDISTSVSNGQAFHFFSNLSEFTEYKVFLKFKEY